MRGRALLKALPCDISSHPVLDISRRDRAREVGAVMNEYFRSIEADFGVGGNDAYINHLDDQASLAALWRDISHYRAKQLKGELPIPPSLGIFLS